MVEDRTAATLILIIKQYFFPGTKVMSDCWKSYDRLKEKGYIHGTVNHSVEFVISLMDSVEREHQTLMASVAKRRFTSRLGSLSTMAFLT